VLLLLDDDVGDAELLEDLQVLLAPCHTSQSAAASTIHHGVEVHVVRVEDDVGDMWGAFTRLALVLRTLNVLVPVSLLATCRAEGT
jgi:hypothetical protein